MGKEKTTLVLLLLTFAFNQFQEVAAYYGGQSQEVAADNDDQPQEVAANNEIQDFFEFEDILSGNSLDDEFDSFGEADMLPQSDREEQLLLSASLLAKGLFAGKAALGSAAVSGVADKANSVRGVINHADLTSRNTLCLHTCRNSPVFETCINHCRSLVGLPPLSFSSLGENNADDGNRSGANDGNQSDAGDDNRSGVDVVDPKLPVEDPNEQTFWKTGLEEIGLMPEVIPGRPCRRLCRSFFGRRRRRCVNTCRRLFGRLPLTSEELLIVDASEHASLSSTSRTPSQGSKRSRYCDEICMDRSGLDESEQTTCVQRCQRAHDQGNFLDRTKFCSRYCDEDRHGRPFRCSRICNDLMDLDRIGQTHDSSTCKPPKCSEQCTDNTATGKRRYSKCVSKCGMATEVEDLLSKLKFCNDYCDAQDDPVKCRLDCNEYLELDRFGHHFRFSTPGKVFPLVPSPQCKRFCTARRPVDHRCVKRCRKAQSQEDLIAAHDRIEAEVRTPTSISRCSNICRDSKLPDSEQVACLVVCREAFDSGVPTVKSGFCTKHCNKTSNPFNCAQKCNALMG